MNTGSPRLYLLITILFAHMSCALVPSPIPTPTANDNICEKAAHHRASCVGNYLTPPICDDTAATIAQEMLAVPCEDFDEAYPEETTADGALCDWFGTGCTPDEVLFDGPACSTDDDCTGQSYCIENHCFDGVTSSQFATTLDHFTDTVEESGSSTALLADNVETRKRRRTLIEGATHSLHFTTLFIYDDEIGVEMVELFSAAARRGVEVRVLVDATSQYSFSNYDPLKELAKAGVDVISFNPITEWAGLRQETPGLTANNRLHEKILIADGKEAVIGGRNIGDAYFLPGRWRDADVYVDGPGVAGIQRKFLTFWDRNSAWELDAGCPNQSIHGFYCPATKTPLLEDPAYFPELKTSGQAYTRAIYSDPYAQETTLGYLTTLALIRSARESITIANAYVVPPRRLRKHLRAAVARGVEVTVITNSKNSTDAWWVYYAGLNYYQELIRAGVKIYEYNGTETLHSKTMLIDGELALIGSFNLDPRSAIDNSEFMLLIRGGQTAKELHQTMEHDRANSTLATDDIPFTELVKASSMRLAEPLL